MHYPLQHLYLIVFVLLCCHRQFLRLFPLLLLSGYGKRTGTIFVYLETNRVDMVFHSGALKFNGVLPCFCFLSQFSSNYVQVIFLLTSFVMLTAACSSRLLFPSADKIRSLSCKVRFAFASEAIFESKFVFLSSKSKGD